MGDGTTQLRPNPVIAELTPLPPQTKKKMPPKRKPAAKKPAARPVASKPAPAAAAPAPTTTQPAQSNSPWPSPPPSR
jgi:hypothetical protein